MGNGFLVFIIIVLAIIAVWQTSKLKQFERLERLLGPGADAASAKQLLAPDVNQTGTGPSADELPGLPPVAVEENIEEANKVQLVKARCRYAEFYIEQLDDEFERAQFQAIAHECVEIAKQISDPFYKSAALQPLILLLNRAGWEDLRNDMLALVEDEHIKNSIDEEMAVEESA